MNLLLVFALFLLGRYLYLVALAALACAHLYRGLTDGDVSVQVVVEARRPLRHEHGTVIVFKRWVATL